MRLFRRKPAREAEAARQAAAARQMNYCIGDYAVEPVRLIPGELVYGRNCATDPVLTCSYVTRPVMPPAGKAADPIVFGPDA